MGLPDPAPIPRASPGLIPEPDRTPALIIHLSPLLGLVLPALGNVLGPLAAWLAYRDRAPVLDQQGKEALNFQLSVWLYAFLTGLLFLALFSLGLLGGVFGAAAGSPHLGALALFGSLAAFFAFFIPASLVLWALPLVVMLLAVLRVSQGQAYRYPLRIRFIR
ncbi:MULTISPECIES: DUF4870 domain-containing protein [Deinococcus]|uniref:DUF4870 domain-containing protein n=1 Tax=Deinococcus geothermalis (strain DSM 11300 / CIP 105573 / AG-3a) TaxID=319795 RepID=Q1IWX0_DEIGD|nr:MULTISPECIES: DUF4870 domain-containing protein [Deinococcus]ABF46264.1 hypothetical protein Dgeo_1970 [Deinococcus geothermalis DSM 11300]TDE86259.1 DUF4870 domain-containing protein [Deinococcus sp. S9]